MKTVKHLGFALLIIGIGLLIYTIADDGNNLTKMQRALVNVVWPVGLLIYSLANAAIKKTENQENG